MTAAQTIAEWTTTLTLDDIPGDVVEHAKLHLLDAIGCGSQPRRSASRPRAGRRWPSSAARPRRR